MDKNLHLCGFGKLRLEQNDLHDLQIAYTKITHCHCASLGLRCSIFFVFFFLLLLLVALYCCCYWFVYCLRLAASNGFHLTKDQTLLWISNEIKITRTHTHTLAVAMQFRQWLTPWVLRLRNCGYCDLCKFIESWRGPKKHFASILVLVFSSRLLVFVVDANGKTTDTKKIVFRPLAARTLWLCVKRNCTAHTKVVAPCSVFV